MLPERIAETISQFVAGCECPALLERGEKPLLLASGRYKIDLTAKGAWFEAWDDSRVWSRRILSAREPSRSKLELEAFRFGNTNLPVTLVDVADSRSGPALEKTSRSAFTQQFKLFLKRHFGGWKWEAFRSEAKLENSFSPIFPTALLTKGREAVAALAAPQRDTGFHALTFALVWLHWVRLNHGEIASSRLLLYLPEGHEGSVVWLARNLNPARVAVEFWVYGKDGSEYQLDPSDHGNLQSTLAPRYSRLAGPEWWVRLISSYRDLEWVEEADGSLSYRIRGLEFARLRAATGNEQPQIEYGMKRKRKANQADSPAIQTLISEILELRNAHPPDRNNPVYLAQPERWIESQVRRNIAEIEATVDPGCLYGQTLGSLEGERSALDLLGIDRDGVLNIFELKATEDIHLPLQAFDYWLRIRHHLACGEFEGNGFFPGREISRNDPRVFLVSPSLHFHPMNCAVLHFLPTHCEMIRIGLNADWRERVDVVLRM